MNERQTPEELAQEMKQLVAQLQVEGRNDLLLKAIGVPLLEELRIEAAKRKLSRLVITKDYRFTLVSGEVKVSSVKHIARQRLICEPVHRVDSA